MSTDKTEQALADRLKADAMAIFNDPPSMTAQEVRDVIEWYDASLRVALTAAPPAQPKAIAWVPVHPKTGPLWAMTTDDPSPERLPSYPLRALAWTETPPAQPQEPVEYGATDFGYTFAGIELSDGAKRLMSMLVRAFGTDHPAVDDMTAILFAASPPRAVEPPKHIRLMAQSVLHTIADAAHPREDIDLDAVRAVATYITAKP